MDDDKTRALNGRLRFERPALTRTAFDLWQDRQASGFTKRAGKTVMADGLVSRRGYRRIEPGSSGYAGMEDDAEALELTAQQILSGDQATVFTARVLDPLNGKPRQSYEALASNLGLPVRRLQKIQEKALAKVVRALKRGRPAVRKLAKPVQVGTAPPLPVEPWMDSIIEATMAGEAADLFNSAADAIDSLFGAGFFGVRLEYEPFRLKALAPHGISRAISLLLCLRTDETTIKAREAIPPLSKRHFAKLFAVARSQAATQVDAAVAACPALSADEQDSLRDRLHASPFYRDEQSFALTRSFRRPEIEYGPEIWAWMLDFLLAFTPGKNK